MQSRLDPFTATFLAYFCIAVIIKVRLFHIQGGKAEILVDNWTFSAAFVSYMVVVTGSLYEYFFTGPQVILPIAMLGYMTATAGLMITRYSVRSLGPYWSVRIEVKRGHEILVKGPYRFSRHPYYLATLLELGGLCLILNSFWTLLYLSVAHIPILVARIQSEERVLIASLGERYLAYRNRVPILPTLSSLKLGRGRNWSTP